MTEPFTEQLAEMKALLPQTNEVAGYLRPSGGGGGSPTALSLSFTGQFNYPYPFELINPETLQLGNAAPISASGCWLGATGFIYGETGTEINPLTTLTFVNLAGTSGLGLGISISNMAALTELNCPALIYIGGNFGVSSMPVLTVLSLPVLTVVTESFTTGSMAALTTLNLPALAYVGIAFTPGGTGSLPALTTLNLPVLATVGGGFSPGNLPVLTTLNLPALTTILGSGLSPFGMPALIAVTLPAIVTINGNINFSDGAETALTTFTLGSTLKSVTGNVLFPSSALDQASVDNILIRLAALDGTAGTTLYTGHAVTITGTSATPSAPGLAAKATLISRSNTVTTN